MKTQLRSLLAAALVAAVSLVGVGARPAEALTPLAGQPVNVSKKTGNQLEAAIAADPTNPSRVFVATNDETLNFKGLATARSSDGGATWTSGTVATGPTPGDGFTFACCDPSVSWDSFGNLFFAYLGFPGGTTQTVELLRSSDGGQTFSLVTQIASATGLDQPTVTTGAGEVWVTWKQGTIRARGASVTGLGTVGAFTAAATLGAGNFGDVAIGPAGQVVVTYQDNTGGQGLSNIFTQVDADGVGMGGFSAAVAATTTNTPRATASSTTAILGSCDRSVGG